MLLLRSSKVFLYPIYSLQNKGVNQEENRNLQEKVERKHQDNGKG